MKQSAFLSICYFCLFLLTAFQCEQKEEIYPESTCTAHATLRGTWRLEAYQTLATGALDIDPDPKGRGRVFTFSEENSTGKISGHTVANTVFGSYQRADSCRLESVAFGGTKVGERSIWSARVGAAMSNVSHFGQANDRLYLYYNNRSERVIFRKY
jgi:hypothetical protein